MFLGGGAASVIAGGRTQCATQLKVLIFIHKSTHKAVSFVCCSEKRPPLISPGFYLFIILVKNNNDEMKLVDVWRTGGVDVDFSSSWQEFPARPGLPGAVRL